MTFAPGSSLLLVPLGALGLVFGSFVTALSYRLPRGESIARGRSRCPHCQRALGAPDLVPVLSWVVQGGKCRHCRVPISWRYPMIESVSAALFIAAGVFAGDAVHLMLLLAMTPVMLALAVVDLEYRRLPNILIVALAGLAVAWRWYGDQALLTGLATALGMGVIGVLMDWAARRWSGKVGIGQGDIKLLASAGLALSVPEFLLFVGLAGGLGAGFGLVWQRVAKAHQFPFAPAVLLSYWLCLLAADNILKQLIISLSA